jgi:hypothetical protein
LLILVTAISRNPLGAANGTESGIFDHPRRGGRVWSIAAVLKTVGGHYPPRRFKSDLLRPLFDVEAQIRATDCHVH